MSYFLIVHYLRQVMWLISFNIVWHYSTIKCNLDVFPFGWISIGLGFFQRSLCRQRGFGVVVGVTCKDECLELSIIQTRKDLCRAFLKTHFSKLIFSNHLLLLELLAD